MAAGDTDTFTSDTITAPEQPDASMSEAYSGDVQPRVSVAPKSSVVVRPVQARPSEPQVPRDALNRAYYTLDFYQKNPQWLADPDTMHAAQAHLANSSRMIEMSIQLERVNQMADTAKLKLNTDTRLVNHLNEGLAKLKDMTTVAAIRDEVQANGPSPLAISMLNQALARENPPKPISATGKEIFDKSNFLKAGGTEADWEKAVAERKALDANSGLLENAKRLEDEGDTEGAAALRAIVARRGEAKPMTWIVGTDILGKNQTAKMSPKAFYEAFNSLPEEARTNAVNIANLKSAGFDVPSAAAPAAEPTTGGPSQSDIDYLKKNPGVRDLFEKKFGKGSAASYLK